MQMCSPRLTLLIRQFREEEERDWGGLFYKCFLSVQNAQAMTMILSIVMITYFLYSTTVFDSSIKKGSRLHISCSPVSLVCLVSNSQ